MDMAIRTNANSVDHLTHAELRLMRALARGASNKKLAAEFGKSEYTVRNQLSAMFKKMSVSNRTQAVVKHREQTDAAVAKGQPFGTSVLLRGVLEARKIDHEVFIT